MQDTRGYLMIKRRTGKECKKVKCRYYEDRFKLGSDSIRHCMECKEAYNSQYILETHHKVIQ